MKSLFIAIMLLAQISFAAKMTELKVDTAAPTFTAKTQEGKEIKLVDYKGKWVVMEWYNEGCPYVKKHYGSKNMQTLQKTYTDKGAVWLTVATSAKGEQGYVAPEKAKDAFKTAGMNSTALLLDAEGTIGKTYGAVTTPHMFVINPEGKLVYAGAIDSDSSSDPAKIPGAINYVASALDEGMSGKTITKKTSKPYGCSVKYN